MVDVLLIQPPIRDFYLTAKRTIPHGLACIAASLEKEGLSVEILDGLATAKSRIIELPTEMSGLKPFYRGPDLSPFSLFHHYRYYGYSLEHLAAKAKASGAFLIGISSLFTAYGEMALATAEAVREVCAGATIVMGGHHPTARPQSVMASSAVDYVLRGEGEVSLPLLARAIRERRSVRGIPGIVFRKPDKSLDISAPAVMADLDAYPLPALHLLRNDYYRRAAGGTAVIMTSRGCPMRCSYCSMGNSAILPYRQRNYDRVLAEIDVAVKQVGVRFIDFEDEHLTLHREPMLRFLEQLIVRFRDYDLEFRAMNGLYPRSLDAEMLLLMKQAGFRTLNLSLCSISPGQLQRFNRPDVSRAFDRILKESLTLGLDMVGYMIVGAPDQDPLESVADLLFLAQRNVLAGVSVYYPAPGSSDFEACRQRGLLPENEMLMRASALPISATTTREDSATLMRLGRILNFMKYLDDHPDICSGENTRRKGASLHQERLEQGVKLLQMFFQDGHIRGITPDGKLFDHRVSLKLTGAFIDGFRKEGNRFQRWRPQTLDQL
ncbi:MAG: radical SAM protein [bacterium]